MLKLEDNNSIFKCFEGSECIISSYKNMYKVYIIRKLKANVSTEKKLNYKMSKLCKKNLKCEKKLQITDSGKIKNVRKMSKL